MEKRRLPLTLPCATCPHGSACCDHGVDVTEAEAARIAARWGRDTLVVRDGETRTKVVAGKCVFYVREKGCAIHAEPEYPLTCRLFPWRDSDAPQAPYPHDVDICPELTNDMDRSVRDRLPTAARMVFRWWREDDVERARELWGDPRVTAFIDSRTALSRPDVEERLTAELRRAERDGVQYWPMFLRDAGSLVGCAGLRVRDRPSRVYELGFHLCARAWGQGLATEAAVAVTRFAFDELGATELFAGHHPDNAASKRVLEKLGFRRTHEELYPPTGLLHPGYSLIGYPDCH